MAALVADTSALVSLGVVAGGEPDPFAFCTARYEVLVPDAVVDELRDVAVHDDVHGRAAVAVLDRTDAVERCAVDLDQEFPLDDGENAAVTLANERGAAILLCDEFRSLGLVHASLADSRLITTPTLLSVLVRSGEPSPEQARTLLDEIAAARSWPGNSYVERARALLGDE